MSFVHPLTQMLVLQSLYVMLGILLSILVCATASLVCVCLVSVQVSAPYAIAGSIRALYTCLFRQMVAFEDIPVFGICRPDCHNSSLYLFVLVLFIEAVVLSQVHVALDIFHQHVVHVYRGVVYRSAKRRLERNSPSIFTPLFSQFNLLNLLSNVAVNSLCEMVSYSSLDPDFLNLFVQTYCH